MNLNGSSRNIVPVGMTGVVRLDNLSTNSVDLFVAFHPACYKDGVFWEASYVLDRDTGTWEDEVSVLTWSYLPVRLRVDYVKMSCMPSINDLLDRCRSIWQAQIDEAAKL